MRDTHEHRQMNVYLIYAPNGDIYHREEDCLMDDLHDHMEQGECTLKAWGRDIDLDDHRAPMFTIEGNKAIQEWITQRVEK